MHCLAVGVSSPKVCIYILQDADEGIIVIYVCQAAFRTETIDCGDKDFSFSQRGERRQVLRSQN